MKIVYTVAEFKASAQLGMAAMEHFDAKTYDKVKDLTVSELCAMDITGRTTYSALSDTVTVEIEEDKYLKVNKILLRYVRPIVGACLAIKGILMTLKFTFKDLEKELDEVFPKGGDVKLPAPQPAPAPAAKPRAPYGSKAAAKKPAAKPATKKAPAKKPAAKKVSAE